SSQIRGFRANWDEESKEKPESSAAKRPLKVEPSSTLNQFGYYIPGFAQEPIMKSEVSWEVTAHVEIANDGTTEHVFLLSSSGDKAINSKVERMLYQGSVFTTGTACSGRVVVSFRGDK
ncbi:hypothetical protein BVX97_02810, partial [bacterium E08(2017)]